MFIFALSPRYLKTSILALLVLMIVLACSYVFVAFAYSGSAISNAKLDGIDINGMDTGAFREFVVQRVDELEKTPILLTVHQRSHSFQPEELGITYDAEGTIERVLNSQGEGFEYYVSVMSNLINGREFETVVSFDRKIANETIYEKIEELRRPRNAELVAENGEWKVVPSEMGYDTNMGELLNRIGVYLRIVGKREFSLATYARHPSFTTDEAEWLLADVKKLTEKEHSLKVRVGNNDHIFPISFNDSKDWVMITRNNEENWEASLNEVMILQRIIDEISPIIERDVQNVEISSFDEVNGRLYADAEGIAQDGLKIDLSATLRNILSNIKDGVTETEIVVQHIPAKITTPTGSPFQFPQRISVGISNYATSSPERIHNVKLGLIKFHNRVLAPGEIFAYNEHVMPITNSAGYKDELAIFGGGGLKKVPGGGLCQVSTTAYRAFFNGGFEVVERYPHSLYVHYYTAYQDGLDATIYPGYGTWKGKDLRVRNDSPYYLLVQTYTNDDTLDAVVQIYGTSDGRKVEIDGPHYLGNTWIGTEYVEDSNLPVGYEEVEARGVAGKSILWNRKITYNDGQEKEEEIFSRYNAKKKVVRIGVGEHGTP